MAEKKSSRLLGFISNEQEEEEVEEVEEVEEIEEIEDSVTQKTEDTSVSEIIKEKLLELVEPKRAKKAKKVKKVVEKKEDSSVEDNPKIEKEKVVPTEIITQKLAPKDTFIPFTEIEDMQFSNKIELNEITFDDISNHEKQNITNEDFEKVLRNDSKEISLDSEGYVYINIMETFVKEIIMDYMKQYGTCTCNHCIIDTMALTLTHLPAKYVVVKKGDLAPLLHMYRQKYSIQISAELLKACLMVSGSPHHKK